MNSGTRKEGEEQIEMEEEKGKEDQRGGQGECKEGLSRGKSGKGHPGGAYSNSWAEQEVSPPGDKILVI